MGMDVVCALLLFFDSCVCCGLTSSGPRWAPGRRIRDPSDREKKRGSRGFLPFTSHRVLNAESARVGPGCERRKKEKAGGRATQARLELEYQRTECIWQDCLQGDAGLHHNEFTEEERVTMAKKDSSWQRVEQCVALSASVVLRKESKQCSERAEVDGKRTLRPAQEVWRVAMFFSFAQLPTILG